MTRLTHRLPHSSSRDRFLEPAFALPEGRVTTQEHTTIKNWAYLGEGLLVPIKDTLEGCTRERSARGAGAATGGRRWGMPQGNDQSGEGTCGALLRDGCDGHYVVGIHGHCLLSVGADGNFDLKDCLMECDPGWYCPNVSPCDPFPNTTAMGPDGINPFAHTPQYCPPSIECAKNRLGSEVCSKSQGIFEPFLCPPGNFCPNTSLMIPCDPGYFCMRGSTQQTPCPSLSYCPAGTELPRYYGGLLACLFLDVALVMLFFFTLYRLEPALQKARKFTNEAILPSLLFVFSQYLSSLTTSSTLEKNSGFSGGDYSAIDENVELGSVTPSASSPPSFSSPNKASQVVLKQSFSRCNGNIDFDLEFENFCYEVPSLKDVGGKKTVLRNVTGRIAAGRVTAIMGPSGAGKTSFLKILFGKEKRTSGSLRINGEIREMSAFKKMVGYVPQEDIVMAELTVRENILFSARMRLPNNWTEPEIQKHVDAVIDVLRLTHSADTQFCKLSGGQRKRTNIALELAMAPAAIFLDEPTSGLDSTVALELCDELTAIARLGITVVTVIHQPRLDIFNKFDDLLLLSPSRDLRLWASGNVAYLGPQDHVVEYFSRLGCSFLGNPSDDIMDALMEVGGHWVGMLEEGSQLMRGVKDAAAAAGKDDVFGAPPPGSPSPPHSPSSRIEEGLLESSFSSLEGRGPEAGGRSKSLGELLCLYWHVCGKEWLISTKVPPSSLSKNFSRGSLQNLDFHGSPGSRPLGGEASKQASFDLVMATKERGAGFLRQFSLCHWRSCVQQYRNITSFALEVGVAVLAGGTMGAAALAVPSLYVGVFKGPYVLISPSPIESLLPSIGLFVALAIAVAASPAGVKTFGEERANYFREASSGHSTLAYYLAKTISVLFRLTVGAFHFVSIFHFLATPTMAFIDFVVIVWSQYYGVYGLAALTSMLVARENSALLGVIVALVVSTLCGYGPNLNQGKEWGVGWLQDISFSRWALEAFFHAETLAYRNHYMVVEVSAGIWGYTLDRYALDITLIIILGTILRGIAYFLMVFLNRKEQI